MSKSTIQWTDRTENVVDGCVEVCPECNNCYARAWTRRQMGAWKGRDFEDVRCHPDRLRHLITGKPARIFLCSMGDLFHRSVPDEFLDCVWAAMAVGSQHTFQVLTKRPERAKRYLRDLTPERLRAAAQRLDLSKMSRKAATVARARMLVTSYELPLPHVHLGTSVGSQLTAGKIKELQATDVALRFLSCEPLIAELDLRGRLSGIGWVIVGGESGPRARPMDAQWARDIRDRCREAGIPFFFKQTGKLLARRLGLKSRAGHDLEELPVDLQIREFPAAASAPDALVASNVR